MKNVIILTAGLSGSSVLAGLIARAGYWVGDSTYRKPDYDTNENEALVLLNKQLIAEAGYEGDYAVRFDPTAIERITALAGKSDDSPYREFLAACATHEPWLWKDPRLWLTVRYWQHLLDLDRCQFVFLTRDLFQSWLSVLSRRQIQSFDYLKRYTYGINDSISDFLAKTQLPHLHVAYEDIIFHPEATIARLNGFLGTNLETNDIELVYTKPLRKNRSWVDGTKSLLIYLKNYRIRLR